MDCSGYLRWAPPRVRVCARERAAASLAESGLSSSPARWELSSPAPGGLRRLAREANSVELARDNRDEALQGVLEAIVDDDVSELGLGLELVLGDAQAALDLLGVVGAAPDETRA